MTELNDIHLKTNMTKLIAMKLKLSDFNAKFPSVEILNLIQNKASLK